jgi:hemolysin activation/secretion protein
VTPSADSKTTVLVREWVIQGNTVISTESLLAVLAPYTDEPLTMAQIQEAAAQVQRAFESDGWLARVVLPTQDVSAGVVRLQVVEGRLGQVVLQADGARRVSPEQVQALVSAALVPGEVLNTRGVNRGLLLADDLSGVSVSGQLKSGQQEGTTDVLVRTLDEPAWMYEASVDNGNARSVGEYRALFSANWSSPGAWGESYAFQALASEGASYGRVGVTAPVGHSGLKFSAAVSHMDYKVVTKGDDGVVPNIKGSAQTLSADAAYPIIRSRPQNLYFTAGVERRDYVSEVNNTRESDYRVNAYSVGLSGNHFDNFAGSGANAYSLTWVNGRVKKLDPNSGNDEATLGGYNKLRWSLSRQQALINGLTLFASVQGQNTGSKRLDSSENMSLGGPSGVRAYPVGEASGPQGVLSTLELRWALSSQWVIAPFYDHGRVSKRSDDNLRSYSLQGAGVSATWTDPAGWVGKTTYAYRIGNNPNPTDSAKDQDGSLRKGRFWFALSRSF